MAEKTLKSIKFHGLEDTYKIPSTAEDVGAAPASHEHGASDITSGTLGVARGGTGKATHTGNAVLTGNGTSAVNNVATANGAFYATAANGAPKFGTLPIAQGGTGATTAANARTKLGITPTNIGAVAKNELKILAYNQLDANGNVDLSILTKYPTTPGVFRVGAPFTGLPANIIGYGTLVIFDAGTYMLHLYSDGGGVLFHARTADGVTTPAGWKVAGGCALAWKNASPSSSFGAQTWTSNISAWSVVLIKFAFHTTLTSDEFTWWEVCPIGAAGAANFTSLGGTGYSVAVHRAFATSVNGVSFGNGSYHQGTNYIAEDATRAIPLEIYVM